ncbi:hypothetical protein [Desulfosediminicola ganghwensis]|nr:hypothetical protein [Desulfosediminicola ganghwensis]
MLFVDPAERDLAKFLGILDGTGTGVVVVMNSLSNVLLDREEKK